MFVVAHREANVSSAGPRPRHIVEVVRRVVKIRRKLVDTVVADVKFAAPVESVRVDLTAVLAWVRGALFCSQHGHVNGKVKAFAWGACTAFVDSSLNC